MNPRFAAQTIVWGETIKENYGGILGFLGAEGYEAVETGMRHFYPERASHYKELFHRYSITPLAVHIGGKFWEPGQAEEERKKFDLSIRFAREVGFQYLVVSGNPEETRVTMEQTFKIYESMGQACRKQRIRFAYHNHNWELKNGAEIYRVLIRRTKAEDVSFVLDIAWAFLAGMPLAELFELTAGRVAYVHVKDVRVGEGTHEFCELGTGELPLEEARRLILEYQIPWVVVEQDTTRFAPEDSMRKNLSFLKTLFES